MLIRLCPRPAEPWAVTVVWLQRPASPLFYRAQRTLEFHKQINGGVKRTLYRTVLVSVANSAREICEYLKKINVPSTVPLQVAQIATECHKYVGAGTWVSGPLRWGAGREYSFYTMFHVAVLLRDRDQIEVFMLHERFSIPYGTHEQ